MTAAPAPRIVLALTEHELRLAARRGESLLATFAIPVAVLLFFGAVDVLPTGDGRPVDFLLPGALALAVVASGLVALGIATGYERAYGVLKRLGGSPATRLHVVGAKVLALLVVELVQAGVLVAVAVAAFGWSPGPGADPLLVLAALALGTAAFGGLGLLIAGTLRAEATLALTNGLFLALLLLGGIVVPLERLPGAVASIARVLPAAALADALRVGLGSAPGDALEPVGILAAWALAAVVLAAWRFRWD